MAAGRMTGRGVARSRFAVFPLYFQRNDRRRQGGQSRDRVSLDLSGAHRADRIVRDAPDAAGLVGVIASGQYSPWISGECCADCHGDPLQARRVAIRAMRT